MQHRQLIKLLLILLVGYVSLAPTYKDNSWQLVHKRADPKLQEISSATAMIVINKGLVKNENGTYQLKTKPLSTNRTRFCPNEAFSENMRATFGRCGGVLFSKQYLVSAGHCIDSEEQIKNRYFVFGVTDINKPIDAENVFTGTIAERIYQDDLDLVFIKLDRPAEKITPVSWLNTSELNIETPVVLVGSPLGLPQVFSHGQIRASDELLGYATDVNCARGMSGSGYYDKKGNFAGVHIGGDPASISENEENACLQWTKADAETYQFLQSTETKGRGPLIGGCAMLPLSKLKNYLTKYSEQDKSKTTKDLASAGE